MCSQPRPATAGQTAVFIQAYSRDLEELEIRSYYHRGLYSHTICTAGDAGVGTDEILQRKDYMPPALAVSILFAVWRVRRIDLVSQFGTHVSVARFTVRFVQYATAGHGES